MAIRPSNSEMQRRRVQIPNVTGTEVNLTEAFETFKKAISYTKVALVTVRLRGRMVWKSIDRDKSAGHRQ